MRSFGRYCAAIVTLTVALVPVAYSQAPSKENDGQDSSEPIEEIVVVGEKSLTKLRLELYKAEDNAYALFNAINSNDDFDIRCYREAPIGSRVLRRICKPNYEREATAEEARDFLLGIRGSPPWGAIELKNKRLREEMEALVVANPEFFKALNKVAEAGQALRAERNRRCEGKAILCGK